MSKRHHFYLHSGPAGRDRKGFAKHRIILGENNPSNTMYTQLDIPSWLAVPTVKSLFGQSVAKVILSIERSVDAIIIETRSGANDDQKNEFLERLNNHYHKQLMLFQ